MKMHNLISIVVPVYNQERYLNRCIESLIGQSYSNLEIILIDDGSTDNSSDICDQYAKKDLRIKVIHQKNKGLSCARNVGIDISTGDYIGFVDSDDYIESCMYERLLIECIENHSDISVCGRYDVDKNGIRKKGKCPLYNRVMDMEDALLAVLSAEETDSIVCDKLYKKKLFDSIRFPVGKYYEDLAVTYEIIMKCDRVSFIDEPFYNYVHHGNGITQSKNIKYAIDYCEHSKISLEKLSRKSHQLYMYAIFIRIYALSFFLRIYKKQDAEVKKKYFDEASNYRKELLSYSRIWLFAKKFSLKQKILYLFLSTNLYGFFK